MNKSSWKSQEELTIPIKKDNRTLPDEMEQKEQGGKKNWFHNKWLQEFIKAPTQKKSRHYGLTKSGLDFF